jgi:prevent-host-death family protein
MVRSSDITSFTEHRKHLRDHLNQVRTTGRPLFVTTNGEADAVVLSAGAFDELVERAELAASLEVLDRSMEQVRGGRGQELRAAVLELQREFGLPRDR